jgi:epoxyqueuosine reductase
VNGVTHSIETQIKARANSLGFSLVGITTADELQMHVRYLDWLELKHHAGMGYLDSRYHKQVRKDPRQLFPGVKSIIVLGLEYPLHNIELLDNSAIGLIGGYASGEDYHTRIPKMLAPFISFISQKLKPSASTKIFTDSAPILERELGVRAGFGWIGKNSCLISPQIGSNFLLAEVFLDQELDPDTPFDKDRCGNCTRCIDACPTQCILSNRTIDSNRCISYNTIENRGEIPPEIMQKLDNWLFGCDVCQMVCPWNKQSGSKSGTDVQEGILNASQMLSILRMTEDEFGTMFKSTALMRARRTGIIRNILIRSGRDLTTRSVLAEYLINENDPVIRKTLRWVLDQK